MGDDKYPKTIVTAPGDMEMSRTEEAPMDENDPLRLTLSEKLKNHYNKGLKKRSRTLDNTMTPQFLNR